MTHLSNFPPREVYSILDDALGDKFAGAKAKRLIEAVTDGRDNPVAQRFMTSLGSKLDPQYQFAYALRERSEDVLRSFTRGPIITEPSSQIMTARNADALVPLLYSHEVVYYHDLFTLAALWYDDDGINTRAIGTATAAQLRTFAEYREIAETGAIEWVDASPYIATPGFLNEVYESVRKQLGGKPFSEAQTGRYKAMLFLHLMGRTGSVPILSPSSDPYWIKLVRSLTAQQDEILRKAQHKRKRKKQDHSQTPEVIPRAADLGTLAVLDIPSPYLPAPRDILLLRRDSDRFAEWRAQLHLALIEASKVEKDDNWQRAAAKVVADYLTPPTLALERELKRSSLNMNFREGGVTFGISASGAAASGLITGSYTAGLITGATTSTIALANQIRKSQTGRRTTEALLNHYLSFVRKD